ncbi:MAG: hypothetical protein ATN35_03245 [Epulopiscium sp. Nele67-Bin004]|nr:MAG: hypothetical protein ATN35_03245 [Epulopiscium sp. Nele67-Bin004]
MRHLSLPQEEYSEPSKAATFSVPSELVSKIRIANSAAKKKGISFTQPTMINDMIIEMRRSDTIILYSISGVQYTGKELYRKYLERSIVPNMYRQLIDIERKLHDAAQTKAINEECVKDGKQVEVFTVELVDAMYHKIWPEYKAPIANILQQLKIDLAVYLFESEKLDRLTTDEISRIDEIYDNLMPIQDEYKILRAVAIYRNRRRPNVLEAHEKQLWTQIDDWYTNEIENIHKLLTLMKEK